ncbi:MAG: hypothetical protein IKB97_05855 [Bacteroidaceae bacterium]|nr:hypothetical protein [Fibrobacter sp.]MBR2863065.1 hypothetical protein [Bacteroidaceae bacterium]MBR6317267.1 hypothetical protein [Fibrobacter sp.]
MTELDKRFEKFLDFVKDAPGYVKENLMCYYYHNTSACSLCPKENCKAREPRPIAEQTVDPSEIAEYVVRIDEHSLFAVPNPKEYFNLFEHVITQLGRGEYVKLFTERCPYTEEDKKAIVRKFRGE